MPAGSVLFVEQPGNGGKCPFLPVLTCRKDRTELKELIRQNKELPGFPQ